MKTRDILANALPKLRRFSYSLTSNKAEADDLVQDVVVKVLELGLPEDRVDYLPWLFRVCKNLWLDKLRHVEVRRKYVEQSSHTPEATRTGSPETHFQVERVIRGFENLPEQHRIALSLVAIEGLGYSEVAEVLDIPIGTVMSRVSRARMMMKNTFGAFTEEAL